MTKINEHSVHIFYVLLTVLLFYVSTVGCEKPNGRGWVTQPVRSPGQLGLAVVDALNNRDIEKLNRLRVQREAYLDWIWPAFPASRPPNNFPGDFAWSNLNKRCNIGMKKWITRYGGQNLEFVAIRFDRPTETYQGFQLLRGTVLMLKNAAGEKGELRILGSVVVKKDRYKLLSYED